jgi:hypothetical protein
MSEAGALGEQATGGGASLIADHWPLDGTPLKAAASTYMSDLSNLGFKSLWHLHKSACNFGSAGPPGLL